MKTLLSFSMLFFLLVIATVQGQEQYTIEGKQYTLKTEVEGGLTLLWNTIDDQYRYFSRKGDEILELKNTRVNGDYQEEYKEVLQLQTADENISLESVNFTLSNLKEFFVEYNSLVDPDFSNPYRTVKIRTRLGAFVGISNNIYTQNPENTLLPTAGIDFEIFENAHLLRHSLVFQFKQTFENSEYKYTASQISLNYRFKFVKSETIDAFINTKVAAYNHSKREILIPATGMIVKESGGSFQAPVTFGLGIDYAVGNGYITFTYNDFVGLGIDGNGEFPVDFSLGYKFNL